MYDSAVARVSTGRMDPRVGVGLDRMGREAWAARRSVWGLDLGAAGGGFEASLCEVEVNVRKAKGKGLGTAIRGGSVLGAELKLERRAERVIRARFMTAGLTEMKVLK